MKKFFENLNLYTKTFAVSFACGFFVSLILMILGFCNILSLFIPLGIFLGSLFSGFSYFVLGKVDDLDIEPVKKTKYSMIIIYVRLFLLIGLEALEVLLWKLTNITLFNPFGFLGAYLFTSIVFMIFYFGEKNVKRN